MRPRLLDLFCGAGGAAMGYHRAGFEVVGVDVADQPEYPFEFVRADALAFLDGLGFDHGFAAVHASPPCQAHSSLRHLADVEYPNLVPPSRVRLWSMGVPYVIENVQGTYLKDPVMICGASIPGLRVIRHRLFESNWGLTGVACPPQHPPVYTTDRRKSHAGKLDQEESFVQVTGGGNARVRVKLEAMGIDWMTSRVSVNQAIPPAYTEHIGRQLLAFLQGRGRAQFPRAAATLSAAA